MPEPCRNGGAGPLRLVKTGPCSTFLVHAPCLDLTTVKGNSPSPAHGLDHQRP
ncbi:hypothetical protein C882_1443 [Caenispirillum salinarum AK4]|uniref:Uncharacterized protein n=1 Tax=Caenispirillum salinarum AK4 TaxID=1238182 RepID=K9GR35_9PROT|nr:hypothetical protein C882_1443 [Caenispirillum salinarum AK4]